MKYMYLYCFAWMRWPGMKLKKQRNKIQTIENKGTGIPSVPAWGQADVLGRHEQEDRVPDLCCCHRYTASCSLLSATLPFFQNKSCYELLYLLCLPLKSCYCFTYHFPCICSYPEFSPCISHAFATQLCSSLAHFLWLCLGLGPPKLQFWLKGPVCGRRISLSIRKSKTLTSHRPEGEWDETVHIQPAVNVICSAGKSHRVQMSMSESWGGVFFAVKTLSGSTDLMQPEHFCKKMPAFLQSF